MATTVNPAGVIDSNILIDAMNGIEDAVAFLEDQQGTEIQISIVSAMEYNLTLYTRNTRHFHMIPQLKINQPY